MADSPRIEELKRRVQSDPASIAFAALAEEYRRSGRFDEAINVCRTGLARHPSYISAHVTLGRALLEIGRYDEARHELEHVLKVAPENLAAIRGLAEIHDRQGQKSEGGDLSSSAIAEMATALAPLQQPAQPSGAPAQPPALPATSAPPVAGPHVSRLARIIGQPGAEQPPQAAGPADMVRAEIAGPAEPAKVEISKRTQASAPVGATRLPDAGVTPELTRPVEAPRVSPAGALPVRPARTSEALPGSSDDTPALPRPIGLAAPGVAKAPDAPMSPVPAGEFALLDGDWDAAGALPWETLQGPAAQQPRAAEPALPSGSSTDTSLASAVPESAAPPENPVLVRLEALLLAIEKARAGAGDLHVF